MDALTLPRRGWLPRRRQRAAALGVGPSFRVVVLLLTTVYFVVPLLASTIFSFQGVGGRPSLASYQASVRRAFALAHPHPVVGDSPGDHRPDPSADRADRGVGQSAAAAPDAG